MREVAAAPHGAGPLHDADEIKPFEHGRHEGERTGQVAAGEGIEARERRRQVVERSRVLEAVPAAEVCHNTVADFARLVPEALHDVHVLVGAAGLADLLYTDEHFPNSIAPETTSMQLLRGRKWATSFPNIVGANHHTVTEPQMPLTRGKRLVRPPGGTRRLGSTIARCGMRA